MKDTWERVGEIGVDAGLCWIGDPCYILHQKELPLTLGMDWQDFCDKLGDNYPTQKEFKYPLGHSGLGVCVSTGYGDGVYPVYVKKNRDGRIVEARVVFEDEE